MRSPREDSRKPALDDNAAPSNAPSEFVSETLVLVRDAQGGDEEAREVLFARFRPFVESFIAFVLGFDSIEDPEDYVQECLFKAWTSLSGFDAQNGAKNFRAWLRACARSVLIDQKRAASAVKRGSGAERRFGDLSTYVAAGLVDPEGETPSEFAARKEANQRFLDALAELPDHKRRLILMRDAAGMDYREIADELSISVELARQQHSRTLKALGEVFESTD